MLTYLIIINIISIFIYGIDKLLAHKRKYRISEFILLSFGFIGGIIGSYIGMYLFKHKTRKIKFKIYLSIYFVIWILLIFKFYS